MYVTDCSHSNSEANRRFEVSSIQQWQESDGSRTSKLNVEAYGMARHKQPNYLIHFYNTSSIFFLLIFYIFARLFFIS